MEPATTKSLYSFIVLNKPEDVIEQRSAIASHAASARWQRQQKQAGDAKHRSDKDGKGFFSWRSGMAPVKQRQQQRQRQRQISHSDGGDSVAFMASSAAWQDNQRFSDFDMTWFPRLTSLGPYRHDPFASYPIKATWVVRQTVDFLLQKWAHDLPTIYASPKFKNEQIELCLPFALQSAIVFHALIAAVRMSLVLHEGRDPASDKAFLYHRGSALANLRNKVAESQVFRGDEVLAAVSTLLFVDYQIGDWSSVVIHWNALKYMEKQWGRLECGSDVEQHHRRCMVGYEGIVAHGKAMLAKQVAVRTADRIELEYPEPPFSPPLSAIIARLPEGFADLAREGLISVEVLKLLALMATSLGYRPDGQAAVRTMKVAPETVSRITNAANHLSNLPLRSLERQVAFGLLAYNWTSHVAEKFSAAYRSVVQDAVDSLAFQGKIKAEEAELRCLVWLSFVIGTAGYQCQPPCSQTDVLLDLVVDLETCRDWARLEGILSLFFENSDLQDKWRQHWHDAMARQAKQNMGILGNQDLLSAN